MKSLSLTFFASMLLASQAYANTKCLQNALSGSPESAWRSATSYASNAVASSVAREAAIKKEQTEMEDLILGRNGQPNDIPPITFFAAEGVKQTYKVRTTFNDGDPITEIIVSNLGQSGILKGTLLVPVSGHVGLENAIAWSKSDTFQIAVDTTKDGGKTWKDDSYDVNDNGISNSPNLIYLANNAKSLGFVTKHDIEVKLEKNQPIRLVYFRSGSSGPAGYYNGRVMQITWDGN